MNVTMTRARVFISYSEADEKERDQLLKHLTPLKRQGLIDAWHNHCVLPGEERQQSISEHLEAADIVVLLVSSDFVSSEYLYDVELRRALERHAAGLCKILPVLVRPVDIQGTSLAQLPLLPTESRSIASWENRDEAWVDVVQGIRHVLHGLPRPRPIKARLERREQRNRERTITKIRQFWIEGVLERSLKGTNLIPLGKEAWTEPPDKGQPPLGMVAVQPEMRRAIPKEKPIIELFDDSAGELVIVGVPGSGKTIALLDLCRSLLDRATSIDNYPIPIVLNLSSWSQNKGKLTNWIIRELDIRYDIPVKLGKEWIEKNTIIPLLDGLDEVPTEHREDCVAEINRFRREVAPEGIVVCSRDLEYKELKNRVRANMVVDLLKIDEHFIVERFFSNQPLHQELLDLLRIPLMLNLAQAIANDNLQNCEHHANLQKNLVEKYIEHSISTRSKGVLSNKNALKWLSWVAGWMKASQNRIFDIGEVQPDVLSRKLFQVYKWTSRFLAWIIVWLTSSVFYLMFMVGFILKTQKQIPLSGLCIALLPLTFPLTIPIGALFERSSNIVPVKKLRFSGKALWDSLKKLTSIEEKHPIIVLSIVMGVITLLGLRLFGGPVWTVIAAITWIPKLGWLIVGFVVIVPFYIVFGLMYTYRDALAMEYDIVEVRSGPLNKLTASFKSYVKYVFMLGFLLPLMLVVFFQSTLEFALILTIFAAFSSLGFGILAVARHLVLRILLKCTNTCPMRMVRFLDSMTNLGILRRVGGGYIFIHSLLLEHFAERKAEPGASLLSSLE